MRKSRWDETWHRLLTWTNGQAPSERLAAQILLNQGFSSIDPSHPLGGKDGGKDAICTKNGKKWVMAVYFPRGEQAFIDVKKKFLGDLQGVKINSAVGIAFVTNQELRLAEREDLKNNSLPFECELFHLERITAVLDQPSMEGIREQFLGIARAEANIIKLGGEGGSAPGAGGGGGAAIGDGARGGNGGPGGNIQLDGEDGEAPGAGGGGGGAIGKDVVGGEGGGGGEIVHRIFHKDELPAVLRVEIGEGGKGGRFGDGLDGGDTILSDPLSGEILVRAKGGKGGCAGKLQVVHRRADAKDAESGLRVIGAYFAECIHFKAGLLDMLSAGWEYFEIPSLNFSVQWPFVFTVLLNELRAEEQIELFAVVRNPAGQEVLRQSSLISRENSSKVAIRHCPHFFEFDVNLVGLWAITIEGADIQLMRLPIEIRLRS